MVIRNGYEIQSRITFTSPSCHFRIGFNSPSFHHWHSTGCHWFWALSHFYQTHATIASDCQTLVITETWNFNANLGSGLQTKQKIDIQFVPSLGLVGAPWHSNFLEFHLPAKRWCPVPPKHFVHQRTLRFFRALWLVLLPSHAHSQ